MRNRTENFPSCRSRTRYYHYWYGLAPVAVDMALGKGSSYSYDDAVLVSMVTLLTTLSVAVFSKGIYAVRCQLCLVFL